MDINSCMTEIMVETQKIKNTGCSPAIGNVLAWLMCVCVWQ